jgi:hypothetical protein
MGKFNQVWTDTNGNKHRVDHGGNHFINNVCANDLKTAEFETVVDIPSDAVEIVMVEVTGHVPLDIYVDERGVTQYVPKV